MVMTHYLRKNWLLGGLLVLTLAASGCEGRGQGNEEVKPVSGEVRTVRTARATAAASQENVEYVGTLSAFRKVRVASQIGGIIENISFEKGDHVRKGQLLGEVDTSTLELEVRQASAAVEVARSQYEKAERGSRPEEIALAEASLKEARAGFLNAERHFERIARLYEIRAVSRKEYDAAEQGKVTASARVESARERLTLARQGPRAEDRKAFKAKLNQAAAALALAQDRFEKSRLQAPIAGIIAFRNVEKGEVVPPGAVLTEVVDLGRLKILFSASEKERGGLRKGTQCPFTVDAIPNARFTCRLTFLSPTADPLSRTFPVECLVDGTDSRMADGMTARVMVPGKREKGSIKVPSSWLSEENGRIGLFVVENGTAVFRKAALGAYYNERVEILSGLHEGDLVIIDAAGLKSGEPVKTE
jgi:multidrug efflux pump subunit AcrA (membrane-fusion protein)